MKKFLWRWLPVILWMIVIYIGSSIGGVPRVGGKAIAANRSPAGPVCETVGRVDCRPRRCFREVKNGR